MADDNPPLPTEDKALEALLGPGESLVVENSRGEDRLAELRNSMACDDLAAVEDLAALLGEEIVKVDPKKPRFYCAGWKRVNEETGKRACTYKSRNRWYDRCPKCQNFYACLPIKQKKFDAAASRQTLGQKTMDAHLATIYWPTGIEEFDRVLNGGLVYGKLLMLAGPRGTAKTTALLQACDGFARDGRKSYFASGEMDGHSNIDYAKRCGIVNENITLYCNPQGIDVDALCADVIATGATFLAVDSIQLCTVSDVKGDLGQPTMIDAAINILSSFAQQKQRAIIIICHLNKNQDYAGSEKGQHLVDGLLRVEPKYMKTADGHTIVDDDGKPIDTRLREFSWDGKSRQGRDDLKALVELTDTGIRPPSMAALRKLSKLHVAK